MTTIFSDTFTVASTTLLTSYTSDSGHTWSNLVGSQTPSVFASFGGVVASGGTAKHIARASALATTVELSAPFSLYFQTNNTTFVWRVGIALHLNTAGDAGYIAAYSWQAGAWYIGKLGASGVITVLATAAASTLSTNTSYSGELIVGAAGLLTLKIAGATVVTYTDPSPIVTPGYPGVYFEGTQQAASNAFIGSLSVSDNNVVAGTATTLTAGSTSGNVGAASSNFTVGANGAITGTVVITPSDGGAGGTFTPTTVSISSSTPTGTFTYTPASAGAKTISTTNNGSLTNPASVTYTASAPTGVISGAALFDNVRFSPYNWDVTNTRAKTFRPGAYFQMIFDGASCVLNFDMTGVGVAPQILYRVDGCGPWVQATVAATVAITIPANVANSTRHYLEVVVKVAGGVNCWTTDSGSVLLTSVTLANSGSTVRLPLTAAVKRGIFYGDSITNGDGAVFGTANDSADAQAGWAYQIAKMLNCQFAINAFGSTSWSAAGGGSTGIPGLSTAWNFKYSGVPLDWSANPPDFIVINMGTNNSSGVAAAVTATLNGMLAAVPTATKIMVLRPFNGSNAANIQAGIAACSAPSRISYIDTTGMLDTAFVDTSGLHPLAFENVSHIVPQLFPLVSAVVNSAAAAPTLTPRTVSLTLGTASGPAANLTGLKVAFHDEANPAAFTVPRYQSASETTDGSGVLTFSVSSTLAAGGTGHLTVLGAADVHYNGPVQVS